MSKVSRKIATGRLVLSGAIALILNGCTNTIDRLFDAPPPPPMAAAPVENRALSKPPEQLTAPSMQPPALAVAPPPAPTATRPAAPEAALQARLEAWKHAWTSRDLPSYLSFYAPAFRGSEATPGKWRANRKRVIGQAGQIELETGTPEIVFIAPDRATLTFSQQYRARNISDRGTKTLQLHQVDGQWLIEQENFTPATRPSR